MSRKNHSSDSSSCLAMALILVVAAPFLGVWLLMQDNEEDKTAGIIILAVSVLFYIAMFIYSICN